MRTTSLPSHQAASVRASDFKREINDLAHRVRTLLLPDDDVEQAELGLVELHLKSASEHLDNLINSRKRPSS